MSMGEHRHDAEVAVYGECVTCAREAIVAARERAKCSDCGAPGPLSLGLCETCARGRGRGFHAEPDRENRPPEAAQPSLFDSRPSVDRNVAPVGHLHPETAKAAARRALPRTGTIRRRVYDYVVAQGDFGATDDEMQRELDLSHQSESPARNTLSDDGWVVPSGRTRVTRYGNPAIVWVAAPDPALDGQAR